MALEKAVQDISLLQANLSYVIRVNEELQTELAVRERREQMRMKEMEKEVCKRDREVNSLRSSQQELASLLEETKQNL